jgi:hypothetical protein
VPKPSADDCSLAIKILEQYQRLARKSDIDVKFPPQRLAVLNRLRDAGTITIEDLGGKFYRRFPGQFKGMTLNRIREICGE